jgi:hypothetical protein
MANGPSSFGSSSPTVFGTRLIKVSARGCTVKSVVFPGKAGAASLLHRLCGAVRIRLGHAVHDAADRIDMRMVGAAATADDGQARQ